MKVADSGGGGDVSSASPEALQAYAESGKHIDAELEASSTRLGGALILFEATCREFSTGVTTTLADELSAFARQTSQDDVWVGRVAEAFARADSSGLSALALDGSHVSDWSVLKRLKYALERALGHLPTDVAQRLEAMLTPENLATLAVVIGIWAASQFFGVGEIADAVMIGVGLFTLGGDAIKVGEDLGSFAMGVARAKNPGDLDHAGQKFADAISIAGIDGAMALLFHKAGERLPARDPAVVPDLVTPEGLVVSVTTDTIVSANTLPVAVEPSVTPASIATEALQGSRAAHDLGADPAATASAAAAEVEGWMAGLPTKATPTNSVRSLYEIAHTGPLNYLVEGGGEKVWADGVRPVDANLLEAKYVDNPARSPYIADSACPDFIRENARIQVDREFARYAAVLADPANPVTDLEVIVSDAGAIPYFEAMLQKYAIRGTVVVRPSSPPGG